MTTNDSLANRCCFIGMFSLALLASLLMPEALFAQLPAARLDWCYPAGASPGGTFEVTVGGDSLDELQSMVFSHPGITAQPKMTEATEFVPAEPVPNVFVVQVAGDVPPGIYEVRVEGRFGLSNPRHFAIDRLQEVVESGSQKTLETAQTVPLASVVSGRAEPNSQDYFKIELSAGQRVLFEASTDSIGSRMIATLEVLTVDGEELAKVRGTSGFRSLLDFTAPSDGVYIVSIYDFLFRGSAEYSYRLGIHQGPFVDWVEPRVIPSGQASEVTVVGRMLGPDSKPAEVTLDGVALERLTVTVNPDELAASPNLLPVAGYSLEAKRLVVEANGHESSPFPLIVSSLPLVTETAPAEGAVQGIPVPGVVSARFSEPAEIDRFDFQAEAGQVFWIECFAHRLGYSVDAVASIYQVTKAEDGTEQLQRLQEVDDPGDRNGSIGSDFDLSTDDPSFRFQAPAAGTFRVEVSDQFGGTRDDPRFQYLLAVRPESPEYELFVTPPQGRQANGNVALIGTLEVRRGGTEKIDVRVIRRDGFAQPLVVSVEGLPAGVTAKPLALSPAASSGTLVLEAAEDAADAVANVRIIGSYTNESGAVTQEARVGTLVLGTGNRQVDPALSRWTDSLPVSVIGQEVEVVRAHPAEATVTSSRGAKLSVPFKLERRHEFKDAVNLAAVGLPGEIKPGPLQFAAEAVDGALALDLANNNLQPGTYRVMVQGDVKFKYIRNPEAITQAQARVDQIAAWKQQWQTTLTESQAALTQLPELVAKTQAELTASQQASQEKQLALIDVARSYAQAGDAWNQARQAAAAPDAAAELTQAAQAAGELVAKQLGELQAATQAATTAATVVQQLTTRLAEQTASEGELKSTIEAAQAKLARLEQLTQPAAQRLEQVTKANQPADVTFTSVAVPLDLVVVASPMTLTGADASVTVGQEGVAAVQLARDYGFAEAVPVTVKGPDGVAGLTLEAGTINPDQTGLEIKIKTTTDTPPGDYPITVSAAAKFNGVDVNASTTLTVKVVPGA